MSALATFKVTGGALIQVNARYCIQLNISAAEADEPSAVGKLFAVILTFRDIAPIAVGLMLKAWALKYHYPRDPSG